MTLAANMAHVASGSRDTSQVPQVGPLNMLLDVRYRRTHLFADILP